MNSKWYISTLIVLLALIGLNQEQTKVANQQIVLQFTDTGMPSTSTHDDALATITAKLQALGITDIEVVKDDSKQLSLQYYSDIDAQNVGEFLSEDGDLSLTFGDIDELPVDFPKDELPESCSLVVLDLQQRTDDILSLNGKLGFELNQDYKRFSDPVVLRFDNSVVLGQDAIQKVAYKINTVVAIAIDNTSRSIPEVRAGPYGTGNC